MSPPNNNAATLAGRGVTNVIALVQRPKHSIGFRHRNGGERPKEDRPYPADPRSAALRLIVDTHLALIDRAPVRVRLFLGNCALQRAQRWCDSHGIGTAWAMADDIDPRSIPWPAGTLVKVIHDEGHPALLNRLLEVSQALRAAGVAYAAFDHQQGWPNLWARDVGGSA